ncbi:MAG: aldo/keto reductase [Solobacterium sp.]|jgi:predicted aldo/keto reductase-like oxidoreductase|nr:aldo/keto reductase [Solobacterium sp.]
MIEETEWKQMPKLGFGLMRLPRINRETDEINIEETKQMTDAFLSAGMKYFDTAYVYQGSEAAAKKALVERHPRDSYYLTSKLNAGSWCVKNAEEAKAEFKTSLERTGAGYFDFYLLHALSQDNVKNYEQYDIWDYVKQLKAEGLIRHYGFSFHDKPDLLDQILTDHPDVEFVQLQLNYADWNSASVCSRENYEVCVKHNKPVVVMEPVKGGMLANPPKQVEEILKQADPEASCASWAVRFAASLPQVMTVLSGMSNMAQMNDNLSYMKAFKPLDESEQQVIRHAQDTLASIPSIQCTACHYCTNGCPMHISIPDIFSAMNKYKIHGDLQGAKASYQMTVSRGAKASECVQCGQCEDACPQHLSIRAFLKECAETLE